MLIKWIKWRIWGRRDVRPSLLGSNFFIFMQFLITICQTHVVHWCQPPFWLAPPGLGNLGSAHADIITVFSSANIQFPFSGQCFHEKLFSINLTTNNFSDYLVLSISNFLNIFFHEVLYSKTSMSHTCVLIQWEVLNEAWILYFNWRSSMSVLWTLHFPVNWNTFSSEPFYA